jgi:hypothetical protein
MLAFASVIEYAQAVIIQTVFTRINILYRMRESRQKEQNLIFPSPNLAIAAVSMLLTNCLGDKKRKATMSPQSLVVFVHGTVSHGRKRSAISKLVRGIYIYLM